MSAASAVLFLAAPSSQPLVPPRSTTTGRLLRDGGNSFPRLSDRAIRDIAVTIVVTDGDNGKITNPIIQALSQIPRRSRRPSRRALHI